MRDNRTDALRRALLAVTAALALHLPAPAAPAQETGWPRTIKHAAGEITLAAKPARIVSTSPSLTGILLAIDVPIVATAATTPSGLTDGKGYFSQWAEVADARGVAVLYSNLNFDIESVIGWNPDLLIVSAGGADTALQHYPELRAQGIPTIVVNYFNRPWQEIATEIGRATGHEAEAAAAIRRFDDYAAGVAPSITPPAGPVTIVGYNLAGTYSVSRATSPHAQILKALGFEVAGLPEHIRADPAYRGSDFGFVSRETLSSAIAGETVFLLNGTEKDVETFLADPVLANLPAVRNRRVYPLGPTSFRVDYYSGRQLIDTVAGYFRKS
ncbi:iron complex transport system substrate-binding protein [Pseudochelatococcus lubricantis]|uniref:Iron complex transport system substrate-binding protein n=1 Tax=Pseudochelatococcus lubricantis TaxID=1538102 RepID=A0ABX0V5Q7_9HYPH|nr:Fe2+-enterobactin ABC transporter substrate-binding protein [Pseudochelatococcus lubricantis]NIJ59834.1 iron complex transport system substrate-binding protein [Pseudochelatococcus lubricantis]